jgi:hypothetical protein
VNSSKKKWFLFRQTCLVVLLAALPLVYLGFLVPLRYIFIGIVFVAICLLVLWHDAKKKKILYSSIFDKTFETFERPKPSLQIGGSHGFWHFTITFQTEDDLNFSEAGGYLSKFKLGINELCAKSDNNKRPFDVERAVYATWIGRRYFPT